MKSEPDQFSNRIQRTSQLNQETIAELGSMSEADLIKHGYKDDPTAKQDPDVKARMQTLVKGNPKPPF